MKEQLTAITLLLLVAGKAACAQDKIATYAVGKPGTATYEHLSFWVQNGRRTAIYYTYGADRKEAKVKYFGKTKLKNKPGFKVQFSNGHVLSLIPSGLLLTVVDATGKAPKTFAWEYEGPINGIGTFCQDCAADEKEAMQVLRTYYLN